jgi:hypothetical protein
MLWLSTLSLIFIAKLFVFLVALRHVCHSSIRITYLLHHIRHDVHRLRTRINYRLSSRGNYPKPSTLDPCMDSFVSYIFSPFRLHRCR